MLSAAELHTRLHPYDQRAHGSGVPGGPTALMEQCTLVVDPGERHGQRIGACVPFALFQQRLDVCIETVDPSAVASSSTWIDQTGLSIWRSTLGPKASRMRILLKSVRSPAQDPPCTIQTPTRRGR